MEKTCLDYVEPELKGLIQRVMIHYENPNEYLEKNLEWLSKHYATFRGYYSKKLNSLLGDMGIEQVVAISNSGLWLGAMAWL